MITNHNGGEIPSPLYLKLQDGAQKTKTQAAVDVGGKVPAAVGNTRAPRIEVPEATPEDAKRA